MKEREPIITSNLRLYFLLGTGLIDLGKCRLIEDLELSLDYQNVIII